MSHPYDTVEAFVTDASFIRWVKNPVGEDRAYWEAWRSQHPQQEAMLQEARQLVMALQFEEEKPANEKFLEIWGNLVEAEAEEHYPIHITRAEAATRAQGRMWYKVAAVLLVAVAALVYSFITVWPKTVEIQTGYGESRTLFLPDSTKVTLNANSTLRYTEGFHQQRQVWLDGEAFFSVVHQPNHDNFLVHTPELKVEVLGTRFNVNSRRGTSQVVLEEGKVKLNIAHTQPEAAIEMKPGEMVAVNAQTHQVDKKEVTVDTYVAWKNNRLTFVSTSLQDIARLLEDNYGYQVVFAEDSLKQKLFTGSSSVDNLQELLQKLNHIFNLDIKQDGKKLIIQSSL